MTKRCDFCGRFFSDKYDVLIHCPMCRGEMGEDERGFYCTCGEMVKDAGMKCFECHGSYIEAIG